MCCYGVVTENKGLDKLSAELKARVYPRDPVKTWEQSFTTNHDDQLDEDQLDENGDQLDEDRLAGPDYMYLLSAEVFCLDEREKLLKKLDKKVATTSSIY